MARALRAVKSHVDPGLNRWYWFDGTHKRRIAASVPDSRKVAWARKHGALTVWHEETAIWTKKKGYLAA